MGIGRRRRGRRAHVSWGIGGLLCVAVRLLAVSEGHGWVSRVRSGDVFRWNARLRGVRH